MLHDMMLLPNNQAIEHRPRVHKKREEKKSQTYTTKMQGKMDNHTNN